MSSATQIHPDDLSEAELFTSDGRQAVRLPSGMHFDGTTVKVHRQGSGLLLEPISLRRTRTAEEIDAMFAKIDSFCATLCFPMAGTKE